MFGYGGDVDINTRIVHPDDVGRVSRAIQANGDHASVFARIRHRDGYYVPMEIRAALHRDEHGSLVRVLGTLCNATERLQSQAQRLALARALHDSISQGLNSSLMHAQSAAMIVDRMMRRDSGNRAAFTDLITTLAALTDEINMAHKNTCMTIESLRSDLDSLRWYGSVSDIIRALVADLRAAHPNLTVDFSDLTDGQDADGIVGAAFADVAREAFTNITKHAYASLVTVRLFREPDALRLRISDNGCGFRTDDSRADGFGIVGMSERMRLLDGDCTVESHPGEGTTVDAHAVVVRGDQ